MYILSISNLIKVKFKGTMDCGKIMQASNWEQKKCIMPGIKAFALVHNQAGNRKEFAPSEMNIKW